jgi:hypothetical protein
VALIGFLVLALQSPAGAAGVPPQLSEAESQGLAGIAANGALASFAVPLGAVASASAPFVLPRTSPFMPKIPPDTVQARSWWVSAETPGQAIGYLQSHPPAGFREMWSSALEGNPAMPTEVDLASPAVPGARGEIGVEVAAAPRAGGGANIEVIASARWLIPRLATEAVPLAARCCASRCVRTARSRPELARRDGRCRSPAPAGSNTWRRW